MKKDFYKTRESTIYREVSDELVVIQLDTGRFYYFNPDTKAFLDFFKEPRSISQSFVESKADSKTSDEQYLKEFCHFLIQESIMEECSEGTQESAMPSFQKPQFLRKGERTLDDITFLCP